MIHTNIWYNKGYEEGLSFVREEADYEELAAIARAGSIPAGWDIFRAEIRNRFLGTAGFDFDSYTKGFSRACIEIFQRI